MPHSTVSIIIPCYNAAHWIADAVHSALSQTYSRIEVIVVDDGSTDESREIIQSFGERIKFKVIDHHGAAHARNRGVQMASGEFIQFLDADDILFPQCVMRKLNTIMTENADVVYSGGFFYNLKENVGNYEPQAAPGKSHSGAVAHVIANTIVTTLLMCRKASLESIGGFDEELSNGQEHDLLFRFAMEGFKLVYVPEALSLNRIGHNPYSITCGTLKDPNYIETLFSRFEKKLYETTLWTADVREALALRFHYVGVKYLAVGNKTSATMVFRRAKELNRNYTSRLPFLRRCLVPYLGGYLAERFLSLLRHVLMRSE